MELTVPGFKIYKIKQYQHRTKQRHDTGYTGRITENGRIHIQKNWYTTIDTKDAYIIGVKNVGTSPAGIDLHFSVYSKTGQQISTFTKAFGSILPGKSEDLSFQLPHDMAYLKLEGVAVTGNGHQPVYTPVMKSIPGLLGLKAWVVALLLIFVSAMALTEPHIPNAPSVFLPLIAIVVFTMSLLGRTPIWTMFVFLMLVPFSGYTMELSASIFAIAIGYLVLVWNRRASIKDFLCPNATPWGLY